MQVLGTWFRDSFYLSSERGQKEVKSGEWLGARRSLFTSYYLPVTCSRVAS